MKKALLATTLLFTLGFVACAHTPPTSPARKTASEDASHANARQILKKSEGKGNYMVSSAEDRDGIWIVTQDPKLNLALQKDALAILGEKSITEFYLKYLTQTRGKDLFKRNELICSPERIQTEVQILSENPEILLNTAKIFADGKASAFVGNGTLRATANAVEKASVSFTCKHSSCNGVNFKIIRQIAHHNSEDTDRAIIEYSHVNDCGNE